MSSPARSTVSAASGGAVSAAEDVADSIDALYRKDEAVAGKTPPSLVHALAWVADRLGCPRRTQVGGDGGAAEGGEIA
jgi:hypothetical protein